MNTSIFLYLVLNIVEITLAIKSTTNLEYSEDFSKVLSRRKRFIIFPDGSSFQLVFCTENQGYLQIGNVVWFGNTAALAWVLPNDPAIFDTLRDSSKEFNGLRRHDISKHIYYLDENGRVLSKMPYKKRPIVNPAFAKRSVDSATKNHISKTELHERHRNSSIFTKLDENRISFHRESRKDFYEKLEKLFQGLGWNGRECVLRMLCESGKGGTEQGTFLEEIVKATFTLPRVQNYEDLEKKYDVAHRAGDCATLYPECSNLYLQ